MSIVNDMITNQMLAAARSAGNKEVKDLTMHEKTAICFVSGCEMEVDHHESGKITIRTRHGCVVYREGGKFHVNEKKIFGGLN